ncbi:TPA: hypothetical protein ACIOMY_000285 [Streptococcus agalactiae]
MALIDIIEKQLADTQRKISDLDDAYHHSCCQFEEKRINEVGEIIEFNVGCPDW